MTMGGGVGVPPSGGAISRRAAVGVLAGSAGAALVPARAVAATPASGPVDVRDHGAVGDGVADDTEAFRAAVAAAAVAGRRVFVPGGTYRVTGTIPLGYGAVVEGVGPALSVIAMDPGVLADLFVGEGFPVYVELRGLTLDGGFAFDRSRAAPPPGDGRARIEPGGRAGWAVDEVVVRDSDVSVGFADVLRTGGQPTLIVSDRRVVGARGVATVSVAPWIAAREPVAGDDWIVYRSGDLVRGFGRLVIDNCFLVGAKRHGVVLAAGSGETRITRCKIGMSQGCGVVSESGGDGVIADSWFVTTGGANVFTHAAVDLRIHDCLLEGGAGANVLSDWGQVKLEGCDLWGGRAGNVVARKAGWVRCTNLQVRDPGGGGAADHIGADGWPRPNSRAAIDCEFAGPGTGAMISHVVCSSAADADGPFRPMAVVWLRNGDRSNVSDIDLGGGVGFVSGALRDDGAATFVRAVRDHGILPVVADVRPGAVLVRNPLGVTAALALRASQGIVEVRIAGRPVFIGSGEPGGRGWDEQWTSPPIAPGATVRVETRPDDTTVEGWWFGF